MDARAKQKAIFRAKLNAQKREKHRIDSPLVRYNEHDQPICRVCDVLLKSESLWPGHQASRKHHEAVENFKASAAARNQPNNAKHESAKELSKQTESSGVLNAKSEPPVPFLKPKSPALPPNFFDDREIKRQKNGRESQNILITVSVEDPMSAKNQLAEASVSRNRTDRSSTVASKQMGKPEFQASKDFKQVSKSAGGSESKQAKGALPEGFFDDKDAELRARGITPIKPDAKDEYKEFEKLIKDDLQEIDNRLEEEEFDAAEMIEEEEMVEQRSYVERVEMLRRKKLELRASRSAAANSMKVTPKDTSSEDSLSDDEDNENFKVDWRAKHL